MIDPSPQKYIKQANNYYSKVKKKLPNYQTDLEFMNKQLNKKFRFLICGDCTSNCSRMLREFQRAFDTLTYLEKASLYNDYAHITYNCLFNVPQSAYLFPQKKQRIKVLVLSNTTWKWQPKQIQIDFQQRKLTLVQEQIAINLRNYILRHSRNKERQGLVLQSTSNIQYIETFRISNYDGSFQIFQKKIMNLMELSLKSRISSRLGLNLIMIDEKSNQEKASIEDRIHKQNLTKQIEVFNNHEVQNKIRDTATFNGEIINKTITQEAIPVNDSISFDEVKYQFQERNSMGGFSMMRENVYYDYFEQIMRKSYIFETNSNQQLYLSWICDNFNNPKYFDTWKKKLIKVQLLQTHQNKKKIHQIFQTKNSNRVQCTYQRSKHVSNSVYFFDHSKEEQTSQTFKIVFSLIKIQKYDNYVKVTQECQLRMQNNTNQSQLMNLCDIFLGDISLIIKQFDLAANDENEIVINSCLFEQGQLSKIQQFENTSYPDQFFTIQELEKYDQSDSEMSPQMHQISRDYINKQKQAHNFTFLDIRHPMQPFPKSGQKLRYPPGPNKHPFWQGQWRINEKGQMLSINQEKVRAQNGVLKQLLKSMGKNLFSGKSILNVSLPVTVFSTQSFLSNLCNSYSYAPRLLEAAARQPNPIDKLKLVVIFNISAFIAELQMQKPFNPILGETYQATIDGCPVFGQQISHHPPISAIFMKGRGYKLYGHFQCKVNMGINSATGLNDGIMNVVFDDGSSEIKYTSFSGELSGLVYGDRKFALVNSNHFIDVKNRLYLHLKFGKHKGITQYSKMINGIEGKIVQVKGSANLQKFWKLTNKDFVQQYGFIKGCWTDDIYYEQQCLFNSWRDFPYITIPYPYSLQSDSLKRLDLRQRVALNYEKSQQFKEDMQHIQRNDRKLREKYRKS